MKNRISVLGAGRMGSALATAFIKEGHAVMVWNRTADRTRPLADRGARIAKSVEEAIAGAEIVVGNVSDYATTHELLRPDGVTRALRGKVFVQLATGTPTHAREMAVWARQHDIRYLDGAIMATPDIIGQEGCTILYSGPSELFEATRPGLLALGGNPVHAVW
jgi:3-hydroxyisobutyrate dehydrogenase-like beta-hydroxyacid dehydrogenase